MTMALAPTAVHQIETAGEMKSALQIVKDALAPELTDGELTLFAMVAQRSGLDPFAKQIYAVKRKGRVTFQTGIDGLRSVAERTGQFVRSDEPEYSPPCGCKQAPAGHPEWARVIVYRRREGIVVEQPATAYWHEYIPGDGQDFQWKKMPRLMLGKCAEALALRKAFPYVLTDIYTPEEMDQAPTDAPLAAKRSARERVAELAGAIDEAAAAPEAPGEPEPPVLADEPDLVIEPQDVPEQPDEEAVKACGDVAGPGVAEGDVCVLAPSHRGAHRSADNSASWPQAK
jgi:phage recombination protein Bet